MSTAKDGSPSTVASGALSKASHPVVSPLFDQALEAYLSAFSKGEGAK